MLREFHEIIKYLKMLKKIKMIYITLLNHLVNIS